MTLKVKKDGAWKEASSLKVKINGEWKDVSTLYSKKDGAWVTVYSSGALIEFADYPYPIPVAKGWKYSSDKVNWTTVSSDSTINTSGKFTGWVKANKITLSEYYDSTDQKIVAYGNRETGNALSVARYGSTAVTNYNRGYVFGGYNGSTRYDTVDIYYANGNRTTGTSLISARNGLSSFSNNNKAYVCGGQTSDTGYTATVDVYNSSGVRSSGKTLSAGRGYVSSFVIGSKGYVCGGANSSYFWSIVDIYDSSGNRTDGESLSEDRTIPACFTLNSKGYVCGGGTSGGSSNKVDIYDSSGNKTTGSGLSKSRYASTAFVNNSKGYVCGGQYSANSVVTTVDVFDSSGNMTTGTGLGKAISYMTSFVIGSRGYVCGGRYRSGTKYYQSSSTYVYDSSGNRSTGNSISTARDSMPSFVNNEKGYVCGGLGSSVSSVVDVYSDKYETLYFAKLPITEGSTYTLNGESGTADVSKVMEFDSKVSGTIKYKAGDMSPGVKVTVVDESGNVVEGATISLEKIERWDFTNAVCYTTYSGSSIIYYIRGVEGSYPAINSVKIRNDNYGRESIVNTSDPNTASVTIHGPSITTVTVSFYSDADGGGDVVASYTFSGPKIVSGTPPS